MSANLAAMVAMSEAIRDVVEKSSGVTKLTEIPDAHLEAYSQIVTAWGADFSGEVERRKAVT